MKPTNQARGWERRWAGTVTTCIQRFNPFAPNSFFITLGKLLCLGAEGENLLDLLVEFVIYYCINMRADDGVSFTQITKIKYTLFFLEFGFNLEKKGKKEECEEMGRESH